MALQPEQEQLAHPEDLQLARLVARADPQGRRAFVRRLFGRTQRIARSLLGNASDADDAAQECMVVLLDAAKSFQGRSALERWADRVVVRRCRRWQQRSRRRQFPIEGDVTPDELSLSTPAANMQEQLPRPVGDYLAQLPAAQREALVLKHMLGFSLAEIAAEVDAKERTVRDRIAAGLKTLRALIRRDCAIGARKEAVQ